MANPETNTNPNTTPVDDGQSLFFNVMPETEKGGSFVAPTVVAQPKPVEKQVLSEPITDSLSSSIPAQRGSSKKMLLIVLPIIIILLAGGGYALWLSRQNNLDNVDVPKAEEHPAEQPEPEPTQQFATTPKEWLATYFGKDTCTEELVCGDNADPDRDGLTNKEENQFSTDPNNADSDSDGLADGDEIKVFGSSPLKARTAEDPQYADAEYAKGGYDTTSKQLYTKTRLDEVKASLRSYGLHAPTIATLGDRLLSVYGFSEAEVSGQTKSQSAQLPSGVDSSAEAKQDRDSQRLATIKKIGGALVKYKNGAGSGSFPDTTDFAVMMDKIKPYLTSATNTSDPVNSGVFVYAYKTDDKGATFALSYYSETQGLTIRYRSQDAEKDLTAATVNANDETRMSDLESIRSALLVYSAGKTQESSDSFVFPSAANYKTELVPSAILAIPKDPKTGKDYEYKVNAALNSFTLKAIFEKPVAGKTGYVCTLEECKDY